MFFVSFFPLLRFGHRNAAYPRVPARHDPPSVSVESVRNRRSRRAPGWTSGPDATTMLLLNIINRNKDECFLLILALLLYYVMIFLEETEKHR